ncbi:MAG: hypothetical protein KJ718_04765 [Nanoarchaeota archaeon]|nr:hypothetical protein [Nanoarchaeota archaeon]MBU1051839.1 hypothetical protein [Nanoarchaeota archaeon]MBU1988750.1 hypothetical protein [Nanoarchaeota archaeon]
MSEEAVKDGTREDEDGFDPESYVTHRPPKQSAEPIQIGRFSEADREVFNDRLKALGVFDVLEVPAESGEASEALADADGTGGSCELKYKILSEQPDLVPMVRTSVTLYPF